MGLSMGFIHISIHASRGGSDDEPVEVLDLTKTFQSTLPAGEATEIISKIYNDQLISIHASRGGSDNDKIL